MFYFKFSSFFNKILLFQIGAPMLGEVVAVKVAPGRFFFISGDSIKYRCSTVSPKVPTRAKKPPTPYFDKENSKKKFYVSFTLGQNRLYWIQGSPAVLGSLQVLGINTLPPFHPVVVEMMVSNLCQKSCFYKQFIQYRC